MMDRNGKRRVTGHRRPTMTG